MLNILECNFFFVFRSFAIACCENSTSRFYSRICRDRKDQTKFVESKGNEKFFFVFGQIIQRWIFYLTGRCSFVLYDLPNSEVLKVSALKTTPFTCLLTIIFFFSSSPSKWMYHISQEIRRNRFSKFFFTLIIKQNVSNCVSQTIFSKNIFLSWSQIKDLNVKNMKY